MIILLTMMMVMIILLTEMKKEGAGSRGEAGPNLVHFIRKLKSLLPGFLVTQPTYGYPQVAVFDTDCSLLLGVTKKKPHLIHLHLF